MKQLDRMATGPEIVPGVRELDHTADVGLVVRAPDAPEMFRRAAWGLRRLTEADALDDRAESAGAGGSSHAASHQEAARPGTAIEVRTIVLSAPGLGDLLLAWLRELLYVAEVDGLVFVDAEFDRLDEGTLEARVRFAPAARPPIREIKGVTYHGLEVGRDAKGFRARVIFDV